MNYIDSLLPVIKPLYPDFGRPAKNQQGIIRSLVLMLDQQVYSITKWSVKVASDPLLFDSCGFEGNAPSAASYYDFLVRLWLADHELHVKRKPKVKHFVSKPKKKLKAGEKQPPKRAGTVKRLVAKAIKSKLNNFCPDIIFQNLIARCVVDTSSVMGILGDTSDLSVAFDGSPFYSGASHYGVKFARAVLKVSTTVIVPDGFLTLMQDGAGTATVNSGSLEILSLMLLLLTAHMIYPFISKWYRRSAMTVLQRFLHYRTFISCILVYTLKVLSLMGLWTIILSMSC